MRRSTHRDARIAAWDGWGLIVDIRAHMEDKFQWTAENANVMLVMLVRTCRKILKLYPAQSVYK